MQTEPFSESDTRSNQADWLELLVLCSGREASSSALLRVLGLLEEDPEHGSQYDPEAGEYVDEEILEPQSSLLVDEIWAELVYRSDALGPGYPFQVDPVGEGFTIRQKQPVTPEHANAHRNYTACLLIAAARRSQIAQIAANDELSALKRDSARIMQILAVKSAAHFLDGDAYWFGWPRIDEAKSYRAALDKLVAAIGHGKVKRDPPEWSHGDEKDGTVDVVGWRSFPDRTYGSLIIYGQVASGLNWRTKPIKSFITGYFNDWFEDNPTEHWVPAMFIPYMLHGDAKPSKQYSLAEVIEGIARREECVYGIVFDRMRITALSNCDEEATCSAQAQHMNQHPTLMAEVELWLTAIKAYVSA